MALMRTLLSGLLLGLAITIASVWMMQGRVLNFSDCPPGTTDYCQWTLRFVARTFWPLLLATCAISIAALIAAKRYRATRGKAE